MTDKVNTITVKKLLNETIDIIELPKVFELDINEDNISATELVTITTIFTYFINLHEITPEVARIVTRINTVNDIMKINKILTEAQAKYN